MEPVTVFSLCIAALNILLTTIPSVIDKAEQIKNYGIRFERYLECLENGRFSLNVWEGRWAQAKPEDYEALFGKVGWQSIQGRKTKINALLNNILGHLDLREGLPDVRPPPWKRFLAIFTPKRKTKTVHANGASSPTGSFVSATSHLSFSGPVGLRTVDDDDIAVWQVYVRQESQNSSLDPQTPQLRTKPGITVMKRIVGILYSNQQLDRKIDELGKAIDRLHIFSRQLYGKEGHGKLNSDPEREEVEESLHFDRIQRVACEVYQSYLRLRPQYQWKLELRVPNDTEQDSQALKQMAQKGIVYFTVKHRPLADGPILTQELSIRQIEGAMISHLSTNSLDAAMSQIILQSSQTVELVRGTTVELSQSGVPILWTKSLRCLLERSRNDVELQLIFSLERARIAYACTLWMILLWKTDWFANLCSCGFRSAMFGKEAALSMMPPNSNSNSSDGVTTRQEYVFRTQARDGQNHPCPRNYLPANKLYLLGVLLAELFLSEPIDLEVSGSHLRPSDRQRFQSNLDIVKQLENYEAVGKNNPVTRAVDFCFRNATRDEWTRSQQSITKAQTSALIENVLTPVHNYYLIVKGHFGSPWADKVAEEIRRLKDTDLEETDEHVIVAIIPPA
ncbi:hypothetical protein MMC11_004653 [Xylographa trunciseda]|nr:hypothetical protein [Xylographa trunciseda]